MEWLNQAWNWLWLPAHPVQNFWVLWVALTLTWLYWKHTFTKHGDK